MTRQPIRVLIVDDSASVRQVLTTILSEDPGIEVMGAASDAFAAARRLQAELPDVIILDIEMPGMDGLTFLRKIMAQRPIPVIICSTLTEAGSRALFDALEAGAVDVLPKPRIDTRNALMETADRLRHAVRAAAQAKLRPREPRVAIEKKLTADAIMPPPGRRPRAPGHRHASSASAFPPAAPRRCARCWSSCRPMPRHRRRPAHAGEVHRSPSPSGSTASAPWRSRRPRMATRSAPAAS